MAMAGERVLQATVVTVEPALRLQTISLRPTARLAMAALAVTAGPQRLALAAQAAMAGQVEMHPQRARLLQPPSVVLVAWVVQAGLAPRVKVPLVMAARVEMRMQAPITGPVRKVALEAKVALAVLWAGPVVQGEMRSRLSRGITPLLRPGAPAALAEMPAAKVV